MESLIRFLVIFVVLYFFLFALLYLSIERIVFLPWIPGRTLEADPSSLGIAFEELRFAARDGTQLHGWFIPGSREVALLFCHGNAGNISHRLGYVAYFQRLGLPLLIFDYRGYGLSAGHPGEAGVYADARAAWDELRRRGFPAERIVLIGHSLGGAIAAELSLHVDTPLLVLQSSFASLPSIGGRIFPYFLWAPFIPNRFDTAGRLPSSRARRILVAHDRDDPVIPVAEGELLAAAAGPRGEFVEVRGGGHDELFRAGEWLQRLDGELQKIER